MRWFLTVCYSHDDHLLGDIRSPITDHRNHETFECNLCVLKCKGKDMLRRSVRRLRYDP